MTSQTFAYAGEASASASASLASSIGGIFGRTIRSSSSEILPLLGRNAPSPSTKMLHRGGGNVLRMGSGPHTAPLKEDTQRNPCVNARGARLVDTSATCFGCRRGGSVCRDSVQGSAETDGNLRVKADGG